MTDSATIVLINPNLVIQRDDPFTTGIVYMPFGLAYAAASLRSAGFSVQVIDAYGEKPYQSRLTGKFALFGLDEEQINSRIPVDSLAIFIYAINLTNHISTIGIVQYLAHERPHIPVIVLENTQAVTAYSLQFVMQEFFKAGASAVITGESEHRVVRLACWLKENQGECALQTGMFAMDGLGTLDGYQPPLEVIDDLDTLPFPAWDLFPLENYWKLRFGHSPVSSPDGRYMPLLTSRGCPYPCKFCVIPATNKQKWRARSAKNVVDEMEDAIQHFLVNEFHIEDVDPTVSDQRIREICQEIITRGLRVIWKLGSGTKIETMRNEETIDLMAQAGCRYISISPETGSPRLLKAMQKPFDLAHAVRLVKQMNLRGIFSQACFILGFPDETDEDRALTWSLVRDLTRQGIDEIALFIITPVPGAAIYEATDSVPHSNLPQIQGYKSLSDLTFSPSWRSDYAILSHFRLKLYAAFLLWKLWYHPLKFASQPFRFLARRFETKMEMIPYRALVFQRLVRQANRKVAASAKAVL